MKKTVIILILVAGIVNFSNGQFTTQNKEVKTLNNLQAYSMIDVNFYSSFTHITSDEKPASIKWVIGGLGAYIIGALIPHNRESSAYLKNVFYVVGSCAVIYGAYLYWIVERDSAQIGVRIPI